MPNINYQLTDSEEEVLESRRLQVESIRRQEEKLARKRKAVNAWLDAFDPETHCSRGLIPMKKNKKVQSAIKVHQNNMKKKGLKNKVHCDGNPPKFDFNIGAKDWVDAALSKELDPELSKEMVGTVLDTSNFIPQRKTFKIDVPLNVGRLKTAAFQWAVAAQTMGIEVDETVSIISGECGSLYLMYLTIYYDLLLACSGEITIFAEGHPEYVNFRSALTPRVVNGFSYSFDMDQINSMETQLAAGISFVIPFGNGASLSWSNGGLDASSRTTLVNTVPTVVLDDLSDPGIETTLRIWTRMVRYHDPSATLRDMFDKTDYSDTSAVFAQVIGYGEDSFRPYCRIECETAVPGWAHHLSSLDLAGGNNRRGRHSYNTTRGTGVLAHRIYHNYFHKKHFRLMPRQIPLEGILLNYVTTIVQADVISDELGTSGLITQPATSFVGSVSAGEAVEAMTAIIAKRYAIGATIMSGVEALNPNTSVIGAGRQYYVPMDILNFNIPVQLQEALAELSSIEVSRSRDYAELYYPYISMVGTKTRVNVFEGPNGSATSVVSVLRSIYPRIDPTTAFDFGAGGSEAPFLDIAVPDTGYFTGTGPSERRATINDMALRMQGNIMIGTAMADVHVSDLTSLYFTELLTTPTVTDGWSNFTEIQTTSISNKFAFDPNEMSDNLIRLLCVNYADDQKAYIGITGETVSVDINDFWYNLKMPTFLASVHAKQGPGTETAISDEAKIAQHIGGGFIDVLKDVGSVALPVLGQIGGSLLDQYVPGMGGIVSGLGGHFGNMLRQESTRAGEMRAKFYNRVLMSSAKNPYAKILRPFSSRARHNPRSIRRVR